MCHEGSHATRSRRKVSRGGRLLIVDRLRRTTERESLALPSFVEAAGSPAGWGLEMSRPASPTGAVHSVGNDVDNAQPMRFLIGGGSLVPEG